MNFELQYALYDLDEKTPFFFVQEIFAHGDLIVKIGAIAILNSLGSKPKASQVLVNMLSIEPEDATS